MPEDYEDVDPKLYYRYLIRSAALRHGQDPDFLDALGYQESRYNPTAYNQTSGARGIAQFIPATARAYGLDEHSVNDPAAAADAMARYVADRQKEGFTGVGNLAASYFGGPNRAGWGAKTAKYARDVGEIYQTIKSTGSPPQQSRKSQPHIAPLKSPTPVQARQLGLVGQPTATEDQPSTPPPDEPDTTTGTAGTQKAGSQFDTPLSPDDEQRFQQWKQQYAPQDSGADYDLRGAFKAGLAPDPQTGHWPDTFKKPNHPTFSDQSIYAKDRPDLAGHWDGDTYIPAQAPVTNTGQVYPAGEIRGLTDEDRAAIAYKRYRAAVSAAQYAAPTGAQLQGLQDQAAQEQPELAPERPEQAESDKAATEFQQKLAAKQEEIKRKREEFAKEGWFQRAYENVGYGMGGNLGMLGENIRHGYNVLNRAAGSPLGRWEPGIAAEYARKAAEQEEIDPSMTGKVLRAAGGIAPTAAALAIPGLGEAEIAGIGAEGLAIIGTTAATQDWANSPRDAAINTALSLPFVKALGYTAKTLAPILDRMGPGWYNNVAKRAINGGTQAAVGQIYTTLQNVGAQVIKGQPVNASAAFEGALPAAVMAGGLAVAGKIPTLRKAPEAETGLTRTPTNTGEDLPGERNAGGSVVPAPDNRQGPGIALGAPQPAPQGTAGAAPGPFSAEGVTGPGGGPAVDPNGRPLVRPGGPQAPSPPGTQVTQTPSIAEQTTEQTLQQYTQQRPEQQQVVDQLRQDLQQNPNDPVARRRLAAIQKELQLQQPPQPQTPQPQGVPIAAQTLGPEGVQLGQPAPQEVAATGEAETPQEARLGYLQRQMQQLLKQQPKTPKEVRDLEDQIQANAQERVSLGKSVKQAREQAQAQQQQMAQQRDATRQRLLAQREQVAEEGLRQGVEPTVREIARQEKAKVGLFPEEGNLATGFWRPDHTWQDFSRMSDEQLGTLDSQLRAQHDSLMQQAAQLPATSAEVIPIRQHAKAIRDVLQRLGAWTEEKADKAGMAAPPGILEAEGGEQPEGEAPREQMRLRFPPPTLPERYGYGHLSWEAAPGTTPGPGGEVALPGYHTAPAREQLKFTNDINKAIQPVMSDVYKNFGLDYRGTEISPGVYEGRVNPAGQDAVYLAHGIPTPEEVTRIEGALAMKGKVLNQDAMAYHVLDAAKPDGSDANAGIIDIGRNLNRLEMQKLDKLLTERVGKGQYALIGNSDGATVLSFGDLGKFRDGLDGVMADSHLWTKADDGLLGLAKAHSDIFNRDQYDARIKEAASALPGRSPEEGAQALESLYADLSSRVQGVYGKYAKWQEGAKAPEAAAARTEPVAAAPVPTGGGVPRAAAPAARVEPVTPAAPAAQVDLSKVSPEARAAAARPNAEHAQSAIDDYNTLEEEGEPHGPHGKFYDYAYSPASGGFWADRALQEALGVEPTDSNVMRATHSALRQALNVDSMTSVHPGEVGLWLKAHDLGPGTETWDKFGQTYRNYQNKELVPPRPAKAAPAAPQPPATATTAAAAPKQALSAELENSLIAKGQGTIFNGKYTPYAAMGNAALRRQLTTLNRLYGEAVAKGDTKAQAYYDLHRQTVRSLVSWERGKGVKPVTPAEPPGKVEGPVEAPVAAATRRVAPAPAPEAPVEPVEAGPDTLNRAVGHLAGQDETPVEQLNPLEQRIRQFVSNNIEDTEGMNRALQGFAKGVDAYNRYPESWMEGVTPHDIWSEVENAYNARVPQAEVAGGRFREAGPRWGFGEGANAPEGNRPAGYTPYSPTGYVGARGITLDELANPASSLQPRTREGARVAEIRASLLSPENVAATFSPEARRAIEAGTNAANIDRETVEGGLGAYNVAKSTSSPARLAGTYSPQELQFAKRAAELDSTLSPDVRRLVRAKVDTALKPILEEVKQVHDDLRAKVSTDVLEQHSTDSLQMAQQELAQKRRTKPNNEMLAKLEEALYRKGQHLPQPTPGLEAVIPAAEMDGPISEKTRHMVLYHSDLTDHQMDQLHSEPNYLEGFDQGPHVSALKQDEDTGLWNWKGKYSKAWFDSWAQQPGWLDHFNDALAQIETKVEPARQRGGMLWTNPTGFELINRALLMGHLDDPSVPRHDAISAYRRNIASGGYYTVDSEINRAADTLDKLANYSTPGTSWNLSAASKAKLAEVADALRKVLGDKEGASIGKTTGDPVMNAIIDLHEKIHGAVGAYEAEKGWWQAYPLRERVEQGLHDFYGDEEMPEEAFAYTGSRQGERAGLTTEEADKYTDDYLTHMVDMHGPNASFVDAIKELSPRLKEHMDKVLAEYGVKHEATQAQAEAPAAEAGPAEPAAAIRGPTTKAYAPSYGGGDVREAEVRGRGAAGVAEPSGDFDTGAEGGAFRTRYVAAAPAGGGAGVPGGGGGGVAPAAAGGTGAGGGGAPAKGRGWGRITGRTFMNAVGLQRTFETAFHGAVFGKQIVMAMINHPFLVGPKAIEGFTKGFSDQAYKDHASVQSMGRYAEWGRESKLMNSGEASNARKIKQISSTLQADGVSSKDINNLMDTMAGHHNPDMMPFVDQLPVMKELTDWARSRGITKFGEQSMKEFVKNMGEVDDQFGGPEDLKGPLGAVVRTSKHTYFGAMDAARQSLWAYRAEQLERAGHTPTTDPKMFSDLANVINSVTGRGTFTNPQTNQLVNAAGPLMWSARYIKSRLDFFNPLRYISDESIGQFRPEVARINRAEGAKFLASQMAMLGAAYMTAKVLGPAAGVEEVGINPFDEKVPFGTIKFKGRRWEVPGGYIPYLRWAAKEVLSVKHYEQGTQSREEKNPLQIATDFWRNKLSPAAGAAVDMATGSTFRGEQVRMKDWPKEIGSKYLPFVIPDLYEDWHDYHDMPPEMRENPLTSAVGTALRQLGVQNYPANAKPAKMRDVHGDNPLGAEQIRYRINTPTPVRRFDTDTKEYEPMGDFKERRDREAEWWPKYGLQMVQAPGWKELTTAERKDALNALRYRVAREAGQKEPDEDKFDPETIFGSVQGRELSKEERKAQRLGGPREAAGGPSGY